MEKQTEAVWHEPESAEPTTTAPIVGFVPEFNSMWEYSRDGKLRTLNSGQYLTSESYKQIRKIMSSISKTRTLYITLKSGKTFKTEDYDLTRHGIYSFRSYPTQTRQLSWEELENYKQAYDYSTLYPFSDIKPEAWEQVIRASLSDKKGRAMFIGTPRGRNWFYDMFRLGQEAEDKDWKSWHFTTQDNPLIDPTEIESAKKTLSTFAFKQEYMASFDNAGSDVFKEEWLKYGVEPDYGSYYIAVDLAGFEEVAKQAANSKKRLDQTAISVVKVTDDGKWFVKEIAYGRWDIRETAATILLKMREYRPLSVGIERGSLKNAVLPYLSDLMRKNNVYSHIVDLTHGNRKKTDRIIWSLQGRFEHGRIVLNSEEDWDEFKDQLLMFPAQGVHDDLPDSLSYIDQLAVTSYFQDDQEDEWEPLDVISGV